jgi:hypothetical protein
LAFSIYTSGSDFLIDLVRYRISDPKYLVTNVVNENVGVSSGSDSEVFYTANMPIASGFDTHLRAGRWHYQEYDTAEDAQDNRGYLFSIESGSFLIPDGATPPESASTVRVSYSWIEEQSYKFSDREISTYLCDSISTVNKFYYDFGYTFNYDGSSFVLSPNITNKDYASYMYAQYASYLVKKQLESEGFGDRIYVRDINITIDTTKGLSDLQKSAENLLKNFEKNINYLRLKGQEDSFARIDVFSNYRYDSGEEYETSFIKDSDYFGTP